jgi:hypothetical protein
MPLDDFKIGDYLATSGERDSKSGERLAPRSGFIPGTSSPAGDSP